MALPGAPPAPFSPAGFTIDAAPPGDLGQAMVDRTLLLYYSGWWPTDGWQLGTVARLCPRRAFSHMLPADVLPADLCAACTRAE